MERRKNILISPLEWGLGHAARMVPLARMLSQMGHNVIFAAGESLRPFIAEELPGTRFIKFPGFSPAYSSWLPQYLALLFQVPGLVWHSAREHHALKRIVREEKIDIVISDNRFGLWHKGIVSVYVTHMPRIPFPPFFRFLEPAGIMLHRLIIKKYSFCLIPDLPGTFNLSGRLSHNLKLTPGTRYAGILSRFDGTGSDQETRAGRIDRVAAILSGPEPQRSMLGQKLSELFAGGDVPLIIAGTASPDESSRNFRSVTFLGHAGSEALFSLLSTSSHIVCRPGYTTLMELASLGRSALLVPTPGQTEQEYLAGYLSAQGWFEKITQKDLKKLRLTGRPDNDIALRIKAESSQLLTAVLAEILDKEHEKRQAGKSRQEAYPNL